MSTLTYTDYPGWGIYAREVAGYRQAVRIDNQIQCSGQGGWLFNATDQTYTFPPTLEAHIDQAFKNVETALKAAGGRGWKQVYRLNSYHIGLDMETTRVMKECFEKYAGEHRFIWTEIGVAKLGLEEMVVELEVSAYLG